MVSCSKDAKEAQNARHFLTIVTAISFYRMFLVNEVVYYVEIKCQLDTTEVFIADLIACSTCFGNHYSHHQELKSIIQWLLPVVFRAVVFKLLVWCGAEGYVSGLQDTVASSWHFISTY